MRTWPGTPFVRLFVSPRKLAVPVTTTGGTCSPGGDRNRTTTTGGNRRAGNPGRYSYTSGSAVGVSVRSNGTRTGKSDCPD